MDDSDIEVRALMGDTTGIGWINSADISQVKFQSGNMVSESNFWEDVTVDGNLNTGDISLVKSRSGRSVP